MDSNLEDIIKNSTFSILKGTYVYAKVSEIPHTEHFMVSNDEDEITVVTLAEKLGQLKLVERNEENYS